MAYQEGEHAKKTEDPTTRGPIEATARRFGDLAVKLKAARAKHSWFRILVPGLRRLL
jgi:hypothetical protein